LCWFKIARDVYPEISFMQLPSNTEAEDVVFDICDLVSNCIQARSRAWATGQFKKILEVQQQLTTILTLPKIVQQQVAITLLPTKISTGCGRGCI